MIVERLVPGGGGSGSSSRGSAAAEADARARAYTLKASDAEAAEARLEQLEAEEQVLPDGRVTRRMTAGLLRRHAREQCTYRTLTLCAPPGAQIIFRTSGRAVEASSTTWAQVRTDFLMLIFIVAACHF